MALAPVAHVKKRLTIHDFVTSFNQESRDPIPQIHSQLSSIPQSDNHPQLPTTPQSDYHPQLSTTPQSDYNSTTPTDTTLHSVDKDDDLYADPLPPEKLAQIYIRNGKKPPEFTLDNLDRKDDTPKPPEFTLDNLDSNAAPNPPEFTLDNLDRNAHTPKLPSHHNELDTKSISEQADAHIKSDPQKSQIDSDSDLEIEGKPNHINRIQFPQSQSSLYKRLHTIAGVISPGKSRIKNSIVQKKDLDAELLRRAGIQAQDLRNAREIELKSKGIHIKTTEERAKEASEVENLVERARRQAEETRRREREDDDDDEETEDENWESGFEEDADEDGDEEKLQFSGSEEDRFESVDISTLNEETTTLENILDDEQEQTIRIKRKSRRTTIIDDEDESFAPLVDSHTGLSQFFQQSVSTGNADTGDKFDKLRHHVFETDSQELPHLSILELTTYSKQESLSENLDDAPMLQNTQITDTDTQDSARVVPMPPRFSRPESPEPKTKRLIRRPGNPDNVKKCDRKPVENAFVEQEAAESEDEWAGLGGASDDGEDDNGSDMEGMMDDTTQKLDGDKLAAFYAKRDLADDQRQIQKIASDVNGGFKRKRQFALADDYEDYDDEEDPELVEMRRMQRLAMRDKMIEQTGLAGLANNPKKAAFLNSIEDRENDGDASFLDVEETTTFLPEISAENTQTDENEPVKKKPKIMDSQSLWEMVHGEGGNTSQLDQVEFLTDLSSRDTLLNGIVDRTTLHEPIIDNRKMAFGAVDFKSTFKISTKNIVPPRTAEEDAVRAKALQEITRGGRVNAKNAKSSVNYQAKKSISTKKSIVKPAKQHEIEKKRQRQVLGLFAKGDFE
ncbi:Mediator of replication checkpoint protein 1 [Neolecta irregularis DAH-3]|uniref:Mediator of replication checkpoint protein 1 n=1 Tax=Neolecta irregularis (strain DAH-3) TaxID=1198029 RepID=A0A1U7LRF7_NEOID|nr:Mediator of replication checkpoint protein 1 [Neolecta irregularis DAH-3]|eukprot:OLL25163.1 Mediator of replication checkpoint protein 1 [Neolecta irregularis DAH-3]